tara:strand:+ start:484 stop:693 length:210 start_codon:yes stop_codon:yes gene_type:complete
MKVKILVSIAGAEFSYRAGEIVDMPTDTAKAWIEGGNAEKFTGKSVENATDAKSENSMFNTKPKKAKKK